MRRRSNRRAFAPCALIFWAFAADYAFATGLELIAERKKTDLIILKNGDQVTGRVLYVQFGMLQVNSAQVGDVSIEWPNVRSLHSIYAFRVERLGGAVYAGVLDTDAQGGNLIVGTGENAVTLPMQEVYRILPYEADVWHRINGSVALGYNYTKSSGVTQGSFDFDARYADVSLEAKLGAHYAATSTPSGDNSDQASIGSSLYFLRPGKNFWALLGSLQRDQNLGIDGRVLFGAALGRHLYQSPRAEIQGLAGLAFDQEWAAGGGNSQGSLEGVFGGEWRVFKFSYPKVNLDTDLLMYPSITSSPRFRSSLNVTLTFKLTDRFSFKFSGFGNYDSRPPSETAQTLDYGVTTSLAYDFGAVVP